MEFKGLVLVFCLFSVAMDVLLLGLISESPLFSLFSLNPPHNSTVLIVLAEHELGAYQNFF